MIERQGVNPNVWKAYLYTLFGGCARGVWSFSVLSGYLYVLSDNSNWAVGLAEGIQGAAQAIVAIFGGVLADKWRRDRTLALAGIVGILAVVATIITVNIHWFGLNSFTIQYDLLCFSLAMWGSYQGLWNTGLETIFADSIPKQQRSKPTTNKYILQLISTVTGPVIAICLFFGFGDSWNINELRTVLMVGAALCAPPALILFCFNDRDMVTEIHRRRRHSMANERKEASGGGEYSRMLSDAATSDFNRSISEAKSMQEETKFLDYSSQEQQPGNYNAPSQDSGTDSPEAELPTPAMWPSPPQSPRESVAAAGTGLGNVSEGGGGGGGGAGPAISASSLLAPPANRTADARQMSDTSVGSQAVGGVLDSSVRAKRVPYVTIFADVLSGFGSGMTIKFFPLFFKNNLGLSPIQVNSIYVGLPVAMALGSQAAQVLRRRIGRAQTCILYGYLGAMALAAMSQLSQYERYETWYVLVPIYILSSAQHCTRPLKKSILMDYVPKKTRARWNSIDSITRFGWSGSAVVGGYLVDQYSYSTTFLVTAIMQAVAASLFFILIPIVKIEPPRPKVNNPIYTEINKSVNANGVSDGFDYVLPTTDESDGTDNTNRQQQQQKQKQQQQQQQQRRQQQDLATKKMKNSVVKDGENGGQEHDERRELLLPKEEDSKNSYSINVYPDHK